MPMRALDLTGQTFGRLTAVAPVRRTKNRHVVWACQCKCGGTIEAFQNNLTRGHTTSCGCRKAEVCGTMGANSATHGLTKTPEYRAWCSMKKRCHTPTDRKFPSWGGRGVSVCPEWRDSFEVFLTHVGPRPSPRHSLDRFPNNSGNYEPGNVRWATAAEQYANSRDRRPALSLATTRVWRERREAQHA